MGKSGILLILFFSFAVAGCTTVYNPATEQKELIFITSPVEESIGNMLSAKILTQYKLSKDPQKINRVKEIGRRIANVSDRKDITYKFAAIEDDDLNAFTTPGGYVYVNTGVLEKSSDDELACVIGHEVGHVAARHIAKKLQAQIGYDILMSIATRQAGVSELQRAASISYDLMMLGYSRQDELLGDRLGVKYAHKAGYDPYAMISFLKKLKEANGADIGPVFLRSHPYASDRIKMLEMAIPNIINKVDAKKNEPVYNQAIEQNKLKPAEAVIANRPPYRVMCSKCKKIFSGRTRYCPYDGTKLQ